MKAIRYAVALLALLLLVSTVLVARPSAETDRATGDGDVQVTMYSESPMLAAMVAAGDLPPVDDRLPPEPIVREPLEGVGKYSDTLNVFALDTTPWADFGYENMSGPQFLSMDFDGNMLPDLMTDWEVADDLMSVTFSLRRGMKWSDGEPITLDDVLFSYNDMHANPDVSTWTGNINEATAVDEWTFRLSFINPVPAMPGNFATGGGGPWALFPKHYLEKWHIDYNDDAEEMAKEEGFDLWNDALYFHYWWSPLQDFEKPVFLPWTIVRGDTAVIHYERNPYYPRVDTAGQQLPYIDQIVSQVVDGEVYNLKVLTGEADIAFMGATFDNFTLFKESESEGDYTVYELPGLVPIDVGLIFHMLNPDPVKRALFEDLRFRQALSVAVDREEINDLVYFGKGVPRQASSLPGPSWYNPEWAEVYAQYDPELANRLLDEVGLTERDGDGFRLGSDGNRVQLLLQFDGNSGRLKTMELVNEYFAAVGIDSAVKQVDGTFSREFISQERHDFGIRQISSDGVWNVVQWARSWEFWMRANDNIKSGQATMEDYPDGLPGIEPPDWVKQIHDWFLERRDIPSNTARHRELSVIVNEWQAENLFAIGFVGMVPDLYIAKNYMRNVPTRYSPQTTWKGALNVFNDQIWFEGK